MVQIILIAMAWLLGIGSRHYAHTLAGFVAAYAWEHHLGVGGISLDGTDPALSINPNGNWVG